MNSLQITKARLDQQRLNQLLESARQDPGALGELLEFYRPVLRTSAQQQLNPKLFSRCDPDDVVQEACAYAATRFATFRGPNAGAFFGWLMQVMRSQIISLHRRHLCAEQRSIYREQPQTPGDGNPSLSWCTPVSNQATPPSAILSAERAHQVTRLLAGMSPEHALVLRLRCVEGLPFVQVAERMDVSAKTAAKLLREAMGCLARQIRHEAGFSSWIHDAAHHLLAKKV